MDRRVFQPRPDGSAERRRNAIGMAGLILAVGWLWLRFEHTHLPPVPTQTTAARPVSRN